MDPYALCPSGDGWTIVQAYYNGWNPRLFYTPPAPSGLSVTYRGGTTVALNWNQSPGQILSYTVEKFIPYQSDDLFNISASATSFQDTSFPSPAPRLDYGPASYRIKASYSGGDSAWSDSVPLYSFDSSGTASVTRGDGSNFYLAVPGFPQSNVSTVQVVWVQYDFNWDITNSSTWSMPARSFTNGIFRLTIPQAALTTDPPAEVGGDDWFVQTLDASGKYLDTFWAARPYDFDDSYSQFYDGREQLKENLALPLREPFASNNTYCCWMSGPTFGNTPYWFTMVNNAWGPSHYTTPANYAYAGLHELYEYSGFVSASLNRFLPFRNNYLYRNFVIGAGDLDSDGYPTTGVYNDYDAVDLDYLSPPAYLFHEPPSCCPISIPSMLSPAASQYLWIYPDLSQRGLANFGMTWDGRLMTNNVRNWYGLPFLSAKVGYSTSNGEQYTNLYAGGSITQAGNHFYPETAQPNLQTVGYYFCRFNISGSGRCDPFPGLSAFSPTNTTPLLFASVGSVFEVAGYAKQSLLNGFSNIMAYLGQYFDKAYQIDANGHTTTNSAGILSPYGEFLPTVPGPAALVTMPDIATGQRGTGVVNVIKLQLDVNHDGIMDLSFAGPDNASQSRPFVFWCNNNYDRGHNVDCTPVVGGNCDWEEDDVSSSDPAAPCPFTPKIPTPDYEYRDFYGYRQIPCQRDLEDFARLWVYGINSNMLAALPANSKVTLSWGDIGSPNTANPTIDLFQAADPDGGIGYLTNSTIAASQINQNQFGYIGRLAPGGSIQMNLNVYGNIWRGNYFIWCGVTNGSGGLTLTITDGNSSVLAETTSFVQVKEIKQMYERWTCGDNPNFGPTNVAHLALEELPVGAPAFQYGPPETTNSPYILFVHGWNEPIFEKDRFAEISLKRLYWQGYQGCFGSFRWPTYFAFPLGELSLQAANPVNFDNSELNAWKSASGLLNLLTTLTTEYSGKVYVMAHSMGNVVAGEALRLARSNRVMNTYIAMQGAIASHAYDANTPVRDLGSNDSGTPDRYAQYWTNGAPCYFTGLSAAAHYVNFYNTNDWALRLLWTVDQDLKPDAGYGYSSVAALFYEGSLANGTPLGFPQDTYEIFSFCDEARCYALGAQANVGGAFAANQIELDSPPYNFSTQHKYHSGQFRSDNAQRWQFWNTVLIKMGLKEE